MGSLLHDTCGAPYKTQSEPEVTFMSVQGYWSKHLAYGVHEASAAAFWSGTTAIPCDTRLHGRYNNTRRHPKLI